MNPSTFLKLHGKPIELAVMDKYMNFQKECLAKQNQRF